MTWWAPVERPGNDLPYVSFPSVLPVRFTSGPAGQRRRWDRATALPPCLWGLMTAAGPISAVTPGSKDISATFPPLPASDQAVETYKSRTRPHIEFG